MKRYYIELKNKAQEIYEELPRYKKADFVSDAIIEKSERNTNTSYQLEELRKRVEELEKVVFGK